jgi:hypothetical protein
MRLMWIGPAAAGLWHMPPIMALVRDAAPGSRLLVVSDILEEYDKARWQHSFYGEQLWKTYRALTHDPMVDFIDLSLATAGQLGKMAQDADAIVYPCDPLWPAMDVGVERVAKAAGKRPLFLSTHKGLTEAFKKRGTFFDYPISHGDWAQYIVQVAPSPNGHKPVDEKPPLLIAPTVYPIGRDGYSGVERLVGLFAQGLPGAQVIAPTGSKVAKGSTLLASGEADGGYSEPGVGPRVVDVHGSYAVALDFSHAKHLGRMNPNAAHISPIWHDPFIMQPPQPPRNVVAISEWQAARFRERYGQECRVLDPICADGDYFKPGDKPRKDYLLFIGKLHPSKGALEAIEACKALKQKLHIIGPVTAGDPPEYVKKVMAGCDGRNIIYHGEVSERKKLRLMQQAKALFYPVSYPKGFGEAHSHKCVEAMLCGTPCIVKNQGAMREVVDDDETGCLFKTDYGMRSCIREIEDLDHDIVRLVAQRRFDYRAVIGRWQPVMEAVAAGDRW